jgi:SlyX protein
MKVLGERIDELEIQLAHNVRTIDDLNRVITAQWHEIEKLSRRIGGLGDRMHLLEESTDGPPPPEPPPPHY